MNPEPAAPRTRVLLIDDSPAIRAGLRRFFETAGYSVVAEAADGAEGVKAYLEHRPDLVTLDLEMQPVGGMAALKEIRTADPAARVMIVTASFRRSDVLEALSLGAGYVLRKPPRSQKLMEAARRLLAREAANWEG